MNSILSYHCDNQEIINKLVELRKNKQSYDKLFRTTDHDAVLIIKILMPKKTRMTHVKGNTDKTKK